MCLFGIDCTSLFFSFIWWLFRMYYLMVFVIACLMPLIWLPVFYCVVWICNAHCFISYSVWMMLVLFLICNMLAYSSVGIPSPPVESIWALLIVWRLGRKNRQNCCLLNCVQLLCVMICTHMGTVLKFASWFRFRFCLGSWTIFIVSLYHFYRARLC